ncbi:MAG: hypothetical protein WBP81_00415 [Solirubrobacteraceae bacterium]
MTKTDALAGLQQLLAIRDGTAPPAPIQELLALDLVEVTGGRPHFVTGRTRGTAIRSAPSTAGSR